MPHPRFCFIVVVLLLTNLLPAASPAPNLAPNPGMEDGDGGPIGWLPNGDARWDYATVHAGKRALYAGRARVGEPSDWISRPFACSPGSVTVGAWMKAAFCRTPDPAWGPVLVIEFLDADGNSLGEAIPIQPANSTAAKGYGVGVSVLDFDWRYFEGVVAAPLKTAQAQLHFGVRGTWAGWESAIGYAWLDDVRVLAGSHPVLSEDAVGAEALPLLTFTTARGGPVLPLWKKEDNTVFAPGEPIAFLVKPPENTAVDTYTWTVHDGGYDLVLTGEPVEGGEDWATLTLPAHAWPQAAFQRLDVTGHKAGEAVARATITFGVLPPPEAPENAIPQPFNVRGAQRDWYRRVCRRAGIMATTYQFTWNGPGTEPGDYTVDPKHVAGIQALHDAGYEVHVLIWYGCPKWAKWDSADTDIKGRGGPTPDHLYRFAKSLAEATGQTGSWYAYGAEQSFGDPKRAVPFTEQFKAFARGILDGHADAKVMLCSVHGAESDFRYAIDNGLVAAVDAVDFHYATMKDILRNQEMMKAAGAVRPIWMTEVNDFTSPTNSANAASLVRLNTEYAAAGVHRTLWCGVGGVRERRLRPLDPEDASLLWLIDGWHFQPNVQFFALANLAHRVGRLPFARQLPTPGKVSAYLFGDDTRSALVLWAAEPTTLSLRGVPGPVEAVEANTRVLAVPLAPSNGLLQVPVTPTPLILTWPGPGKDAAITAVDTPLIRLSAPVYDAPRGGVLRLPVTVTNPGKVPLTAALRALTMGSFTMIVGEPTITVPAGGTVTREFAMRLPTDERQYRRICHLGLTTQGTFAAASCAINVVDLLATTITPVARTADDRPQTDVRILNLGQTAATVRYRIVSEVTTDSLPGVMEGALDLGGGQAGTVTVTGTPGFPTDRQGAVRARVWTDDGQRAAATRLVSSIMIPRSKSRISFTGKLAEWAGAPSVRANRFDQTGLYYPLDRDSEKASAWWGPRDLSGDLRMLWDADFLYVLADVTDGVHYTPNKTEALWHGDGLEFGVDARDPTVPGPNRFYKFIGARVLDKPYFKLYDRPRGENADAPEEFLQRGKYAITPREGGMVYELAIPWGVLGIRPEAGRIIRFGFCLNEHDNVVPHRTYMMMLREFGAINAVEKCLDELGDGVLIDSLKETRQPR